MPICSTLELNDNFTFKSLRICYNKDLLQKKNIPALKESGLASTGKPSAAERMQQGIPSTSINLSDNRKIVNYFIIPPPSNGMFIREVGQNRLRISYTTKIYDSQFTFL